MKNAPNLKHLPKEKFTEAIIFAGADAFAHARAWESGFGKAVAGDSTPPIYLGPKQLADLANLRIVDKGRRSARVYLAGDIESILINAIAGKLALAGVQDAKLYKGIPDREPEDWRDYLIRLRQQSASGEESIVENYIGVRQMHIDGDLSRMSPNRRGKVLAEYFGKIAINQDSDVVYTYDGAVWVSVSLQELRRTLGAIYDENHTDYSVKGIDAAIDAMKIQIPVMGDERRDLIGFENGVYDLAEREFYPHSPDNWLLHHNGITFTPPADDESPDIHAPHFTRWVTHAAGGDLGKIGRIKAALFMVLANRYDWQLFVEVTGEGGSGKSVFTSIAAILAGENNTASGSMAALDSARSRAQFVGKRLITLPDQVRYVGDGAGIKAITGGDLVEIDAKYEKPFSTVIKAVVLATNNEPMAFTERKGGIARRRVILPFNIPVKDEEKDPDLMKKIRGEIAVIIRHLLEIFSVPEHAKNMLLEQRDSSEALVVKQNTDPLYGFCDHIVALGEAVGMLIGNLNITPRAPRVYLYHAYLAYMEAYGHARPLTLTKFGTDFPAVLKEFGAEYKKARTRTGIRSNLNLSPSADDWLPAVPVTESLI
ncbi:DNA primase [Salmonella enterica subsp. enterica serovar Kingston]|nr:DNA primase [Salmonella enterica subsp. enterica serovar Kingston]EJN2807989.1 DNA primase [Salmonella enterica]